MHIFPFPLLASLRIATIYIFVAVTILVCGISMVRADRLLPAPEGVTITSAISLAEEGDVHKNGVIDSGDTITLHFTIQNNSRVAYPFSTLQTGLNSVALHRFWNLQGTTGIVQENNTVKFANVSVEPYSQITLSTDATVTIFLEGNIHLALSPQLIDQLGNVVPTLVPQSNSVSTMQTADSTSAITIGPWLGEVPSLMKQQIHSVTQPLGTLNQSASSTSSQMLPLPLLETSSASSSSTDVSSSLSSDMSSFSPVTEMNSSASSSFSSAFSSHASSLSSQQGISSSDFPFSTQSTETSASSSLPPLLP